MRKPESFTGNRCRKGFSGMGWMPGWCDSSEPFTPEWARKVKPGPEEMYADFVRDAGKYIPAERMNSYGLFHARTIYEGQREASEEKRVVNLTRNSYVGGQRMG